MLQAGWAEKTAPGGPTLGGGLTESERHQKGGKKGGGAEAVQDIDNIERLGGKDTIGESKPSKWEGVTYMTGK